MPNNAKYKETTGYKKVRENRKSDANTRILRTAGKLKTVINGGKYNLLPLKDYLIGMTVREGDRKYIIDAVYPHMVTGVHSGEGILWGEPYSYKGGFSIADLMEQHIISCDKGYAEVKYYG